MQAATFNLVSFTLGRDGTAEVELAFNLGQGLVTDSRKAPNEDVAKRYIDACLRDFLLIRLDKFLAHKRFIQQASSNPFYQRLPLLNSMEKLTNYILWAHDYALEDICKAILRVADLGHFLNVLPLRNNPSYESSQEEMLSILEFARKFSNPYNINDLIPADRLPASLEAV